MAIRTVCDLFYHSVDTFRKPEHLKYKKDGAWHALTSDELRTAVEELSLGLRALGVEKGDKVAILSENRPEWVIADFATLAIGAADSPFYSTLTPTLVLYILNDSESKIVFVSNAAQAAKGAEVRSQAKYLEQVVRLDAAEVAGTIHFDEVRAKGREALARDKDAVRKRTAEVQPEDLATLIYTSGTTGDPKGVMLTHSNLMSNVLAAAGVMHGFGPDDLCLSFLPL